jgi:hypothetical protein
VRDESFARAGNSGRAQHGKWERMFVPFGSRLVTGARRRRGRPHATTATPSVPTLPVVKNGPVDAERALEEGRGSYAIRHWQDAFDALLRANRRQPLAVLPTDVVNAADRG